MFEDTIAELISGIKEVHLSRQQVLDKIEIPAQSSLGDIAFPCFFLASKLKRNPNEIAKELAEKINRKKPSEIEKVEVKGSYINFFINKKILAERILKDILNQKESYGREKV